MTAPRHDWYLKQWLRYYGKTQADMARELEWNKAKVSLTASGKQQYTRDDVNEAASYLNLHPYEMLMHPDDAMHIRMLRNEIARLASQQPKERGESDEEDGPTARVVSRR